MRLDAQGETRIEGKDGRVTMALARFLRVDFSEPCQLNGRHNR